MVVVVSAAAVLLVWVIGRYDISADKQRRINERLGELRARAGASPVPTTTGSLAGVAPGTPPGGGLSP